MTGARLMDDRGKAYFRRLLLGTRTVPMARRKQEDSSAWAAVMGVAVMAWHTFHAVRRMASGESDKVNVSGHYRKDGRGGHAWVEGHKRSYPL